MLKLSGWSRLTWGRNARAVRSPTDPPFKGPFHSHVRTHGFLGRARGQGGDHDAGCGKRLPPTTRRVPTRPRRPLLQPATPRTARWANLRFHPSRSTGTRSDARRDAQAGVPSTGEASGATCVQRLDGSRDSAIHTKYHISLRSSSMREPRYPLPRVVMYATFRYRRRVSAVRQARRRPTAAPHGRGKVLGTCRAGVRPSASVPAAVCGNVAGSVRRENPAGSAPTL